MIIHEVTSAEDARAFVQFPVKLYRGHPHWIRPIDKDVEDVFDPSKNPSFQDGACARWLLKASDNSIAGRIAAFMNEKTATRGNDQPVGGIGFFECVNDRDCAFTLFEKGKDWLLARGMKAMDGPVNFGNRDRWWGLLVDGFDREPNYLCNYNFAYYRDLFETYGFQTYFRQFTFGRMVASPL